MTIFAFTEIHGRAYPAYVNVSATGMGSAMVSVRSNNNPTADVGRIEMTREQLREMATAILAYCDRP